jgi:hypothetical protein
MPDLDANPKDDANPENPDNTDNNSNDTDDEGAEADEVEGPFDENNQTPTNNEDDMVLTKASLRIIELPYLNTLPC